MDQRELWKPNGKTIRRLRRERGWSRFELALKAVVSPHTIARAEQGAALFPSTLRIIADALGTTAEELSIYQGDEEQYDAALKVRIDRAIQLMAAVDEVTRTLDFTSFTATLQATCHQDLVFTQAYTKEAGVPENISQGLSNFAEGLRARMQIIKRDSPFRVDEIVPVGSHQILFAGVDPAWYESLQAVVMAACTALFTYRGEKIASINHSIQFLSINGQQLAGTAAMLLKR